MGKRSKLKKRMRCAEAEDTPCWCGIKNPYFAPIPSTCGGSGTIDCRCGGDQCVCHWHGEVECLGCEECDERCGYGEDDND